MSDGKMINNLGSPAASFGQPDRLSVLPTVAEPTQPHSPDQPADARIGSTTSSRTALGVALLAPALLCLGLATPAEALVIDVTYDSSVTSLGNSGSVTTADIENAYNSVVTLFEGAITNNVTVSIGVGWGEYGSHSIASGDTSESSENTTGYLSGGFSYSQIVTLFSNNVPADVLPATNPAASTFGYLIPDAEARALGLTPNPAVGADGCACDGYIGFSSTTAFTFNRTAGVASGTYDFIAAAEHETEEVLGRVSSLTTATPIYAEPLDLFRCTTGVNSYSYTTAAYASTNGCKTSLGTLNTADTGGDRGDWAVPNPNTNTDAQDSAAVTGMAMGLSISDEDLLAALGWSFSSNAGGLFSGANAPIGAANGVNNPVSTPEPASVSLFLLGLGSIRLMRRRRLT
jgi:hypothetical protein